MIKRNILAYLKSGKLLHCILCNRKPLYVSKRGNNLDVCEILVCFSHFEFPPFPWLNDTFHEVDSTQCAKLTPVRWSDFISYQVGIFRLVSRQTGHQFWLCVNCKMRFTPQQKRSLRIFSPPCNLEPLKLHV